MAANTATPTANRHERTMERAREWARQHGSLASLPGRHPLAEALRRLMRRDRLDDGERRELAQLGLSFDRRGDAWRAAYDQLVAFVEEHGHAEVSWRYVTDDGFRLGHWVRSQRQRAVGGRITDVEREALALVDLSLSRSSAGT